MRACVRVHRINRRRFCEKNHYLYNPMLVLCVAVEMTSSNSALTDCHIKFDKIHRIKILKCSFHQIRMLGENVYDIVFHTTALYSIENATQKE